MARDEFSKKIQNEIAKRVNYLCSNPDCKKQTSGPRSDSKKSICIGIAAHITAASLGEPRYDHTLSTEQRKSPENGIWLCGNHAKMIDNDPKEYPVELLQKWKSEAVNEARSKISGETIKSVCSLKLDISSKLIFHSRDGEGKCSVHHKYKLTFKVQNCEKKPIKVSYAEIEMPAIVKPNGAEKVEERSNNETWFFRIKNIENLYPEDLKTIGEIFFQMDNSLSLQSCEFGHVKFTIYPENHDPIPFEKPFRECHDF